MSDARLPLASVPTNIALPSVAAAPPLFPIFRKRAAPPPVTPRRAREHAAAPNSAAPSSSSPASSRATLSPYSPSPRKRARVSSPALQSDAPSSPASALIRTPDANDASARAHAQADDYQPSHSRTVSISDYFPVTTLVRDVRRKDASERGGLDNARAQGTEAVPAWRRARRRGMRPLTSLARSHYVADAPASYVSTYVSRLHADADLPPSKISLPALPDSTFLNRDHITALALAFSHSAKAYSARDAREAGAKRLLALGNEEGMLRVIDADEGLGVHPEAKGHWWRAHQNAIFDLQWTEDDSRILSASGDQTLRLHDLASGAPRLLATLRGHTSTIKTTTFVDPLRSGDGAGDGNIVASGGRDGNIHLYDLRCPGTTKETSDAPVLRSARTRSAAKGSCLKPMLTLKQPHNGSSCGRRAEMRSTSRSITSLIALQAMPGTLASGGSFDGIVKLWDIRALSSASSSSRMQQPLASLPDPTVSSRHPSRRPRSVNVLCESPTTGDVYALCGDSRIHALRPAAALCDPPAALLSHTYAHASLPPSAFYIRLAVSPDGAHLAAGSRSAGVQVWDTAAHAHDVAPTLTLDVPHPWGQHAARQPLDVNGIDWGKDLLAASSDDAATRIWRSDQVVAQWMRDEPAAAKADWVGAV
ncbi:hypothetical protein Q5752_005156 [Cryptotrichosporon argae]